MKISNKCILCSFFFLANGLLFSYLTTVVTNNTGFDAFLGFMAAISAAGFVASWIAFGINVDSEKYRC